MSVDFQDVLLFLGIASIVGGVFAFSRPAAAIVFGLFCLAAVRNLARLAALKGSKPERKG